MKIAIVDDKAEDRAQLCTMLEEYFSSHNIIWEIVYFSSGDELLAHFKPGHFQCIFMDIYMDGTDGMDTARIIYEQDPSCRLIFCTVSTTHAVASYEVRAAWYLTKPIDKNRLADAMNAACHKLMKNSRLCDVHVNGTQIHIPYNDIFFMDCANRQVTLHLHSRNLTVDESITELIAILSEDERFLMCNRNTMVNMDLIDLVEDHDFLMKNGAHVPMRQRGRVSLKKKYLAWSLRELRQEGQL